MQKLIEIVTYITNLSTKDVKTCKNHQENLGSMKNFIEASFGRVVMGLDNDNRAWSYFGNVVLKIRESRLLNLQHNLTL